MKEGYAESDLKKVGFEGLFKEQVGARLHALQQIQRSAACMSIQILILLSDLEQAVGVVNEFANRLRGKLAFRFGGQAR